MKMKKLLFCYKFCNIGGVSSVLKQRLNAFDNSYHIDLYFESDNNGAHDLAKFKNVTVYIESNKDNADFHQLTKNSNYTCITFIDSPVLLSQYEPNEKQIIVYEIHSSLLNTIKKIDQSIFTKVNKLFVPSAWSKRFVEHHLPILKHCQIECTIVPNIIDEQLFCKQDNTEMISHNESLEILWVGKLVNDKNWRDAVRIVAELKKIKPNLKFTVVTGSIIDKNVTDEFIENLFLHDINENTTWLHNIPYHEMPHIYQNAARNNGVLLVTSLAESFGMIIIEAQRCGLPVVSNAVGATPEILQHKETGFLFNIDYLTSAVNYILKLQDKFYRSTITSNALKFPSLPTAQDLKDLYLSLIIN